MTPLVAIRKRCMDCRGFHWSEVRDCDPTMEHGEQCPLYPYRFGKKPEQKPEKSALKSIRAFCLHCGCDSSEEVRLCPCTECPLYDYRDGHNPALKGKHGQSKEFLDRIRADALVAKNGTIEQHANETDRKS